ncbi:MAG: hopanoid biosynthesis associated protein HpnK [Gammaproteobacteria bacterium]
MTGDDFGLSVPVNEAVAQAHQKGILTSTSLMVAAPEVNDAVSRANDLPSLNVGLHLVLSNGHSCLPASDLPDLVDSDGNFSNNLVLSGIKMFFSASVKQQLKNEIRAQFEAFKVTGLRLDHVNAHNHLHLHPTVFDAIIEVGKDYGMDAMRVPEEKPLKALIESRKENITRFATWLFLKPFTSRMKKRLAENNIKFNTNVYGFHHSGHMNLDTLVHILPNLEDGLSEIYLHPATGTWDGIDPAAKDYEFEAEYKALIHPRIKRIIEKFSIELTSFHKS